MTVRIPTTVALALCSSACDLVDGHATLPGKLIVYSGARPATADTAIGGQVALVTFTLADPSFDDPADQGVYVAALAHPILPAQAAQSGIATFFRLLDGGDNVVAEGTVTDRNGDGDMTISTTNVIQDIDVTVISLTLSVPKSA